VNKFKKIFTNFRMIILMVLLIFMVISIHPDPYNDGVAIRTVLKNSSAAIAEINSPLATDKPMLREVIFEIDGKSVKSVEDYNQLTENFEVGDVVNIRTRSSYKYSGNERQFSFKKQINKYTLTVLPEYKYTVLNETEEVIVPKIISINKTINGTNVTINKTINETVIRNKIKTEIIGTQGLGLKVYPAPKTNIKKGLDLQGGTRVLLEPEEKVSDEDLEIIMDNLKRRLNIYGLSDILVRKQKDLSGNLFLLIEVAGANEDEVKNLIAGQGKFEAKIGNDTVFRGGDDIKFVCRSADCSYAVDPRRPCAKGSDGQWHCSFQFSITLSPTAAQNQADLTKELKLVTENGQEYLEKSLDLYLDDELVDTLRIGADLKGRPVTDIAISGGGSGETQQDAITDSAKGMKQLQTVLITGSLPVKLNVVKIDTVSPTLGDEFVKNIIFVGILALFIVSIVVVIRYRDIKIAIPMLITMGSEIILLLGFASLIGWNLDLAAIAGILIAVGTGVDDQIVIVDEIKERKSSSLLNWKERIKRAFFIIMAAYFTTVVAMLPLWSAGAGLVRGFAITTIVGVSFGVFVTRPAFAKIMEILIKD
jgi:preprotein translocase subunit SecD